MQKKKMIKVEGRFTTEMINKLKESYGTLPDKLDPDSTALKNIREYLEKYNDDVINQIFSAKIKWVSAIAGAIKAKRGVKKEKDRIKNMPEVEKAAAKIEMMKDIIEEVHEEGPMKLVSLYVYFGEDLFNNMIDFFTYVKQQVKDSKADKIELITKGRISFIGPKSN